MENEWEKRIELYCERLKDLQSRTGDLNSAIVIMREVSKDLRMDRMDAEKTAKGNLPASEKQRLFMEKLGVEFDDKISRKEASVIIDEAIEKKNSA